MTASKVAVDPSRVLYLYWYPGHWGGPGQQRAHRHRDRLEGGDLLQGRHGSVVVIHADCALLGPDPSPLLQLGPDGGAAEQGALLLLPDGLPLQLCRCASVPPSTPSLPFVLTFCHLFFFLFFIKKKVYILKYNLGYIYIFFVTQLIYINVNIYV